MMSELYITTHTAAETMKNPARMNISIPKSKFPVMFSIYRCGIAQMMRINRPVTV